jgi:hypothetical protein
MDKLGWSSKMGNQVLPPSIDSKIPPAAAPM